MTHQQQPQSVPTGPPPSAPPSALPPVAAPEMGERLRAAWADGTLVLPLRDGSSPVRLPGMHKSVLPPSLSGLARVSLAGIGERFAAWRLIPQENAPVIVRIPHVGADELHQDLSHEIAALTLVPAEVGPGPVAFHDDAHSSPIGVPYVVTTEVPGTAAAPSAWTTRSLSAHARLLAQLHTVPAPGRGPVRLGTDPWAGIGARPPSLLAEVEEETRQWRERHGAVIAARGLEPFLEATLKRVAGVESEIAQLDGFVLAHGDLCATNIMWHRAADAAGRSGEPAPRYIDFEWAQGDDPARDLAIIGGSVHGGPWYVPMGEDAVTRLVGDYAAARRDLAGGDPLPAAVAEVGALRERMRAWTAYDRTAMLVHVAARRERDPSYGPVLQELSATLAAELGVAAF